MDEIITKARKLNIEELAITDHDTLLGSIKLLIKLEDSKISAISGIEISANNNNLDIEFLNSL